MASDKEFLEEKLADERTASNSSAGLPRAADDVEQGSPVPLPTQRPLASDTLVKKQRTTQIQHYLGADVSTNRVDVLMLLCCLISGFIDSTIYFAYGTFVSMQTGNTIFIGLGGSTGRVTNKPYGWAKSLVSVFCFVIGSFFFSRMHRIMTPRRRGTLIASFFLQTGIIFTAAALVQGKDSSPGIEGTVANLSSDIDWLQAIPIAILSFQSAGQIVASRALSLNEIPSVVVTSLLCDLVSDPKLWVGLPGNVPRNRRILAFFGILVGAVAGGWLTTETGEIHWALWVAGVLKFMVVLAWVVWPKKIDP